MALLQKENIERVEQSRITLLLAGECYVKNLLIFLFVRWDSNSFNDCHVKCRLCLFASGSIVGDVCLHSSYNNQNQTGLNILGGGRVRDTKNVHFITNLLQLLFTHYSMNNNTHSVMLTLIWLNLINSQYTYSCFFFSYLFNYSTSPRPYIKLVLLVSY